MVLNSLNYSLKIPIGRFCSIDIYYLCIKIGSMKKIGYLVIMLVIALAGCTERQNPLLKQAKDLIDVRPDSAMTILTQVNLRSLSESQKAEYGLIITMADYKTHKSFENDSLISACLAYFDRHGDDWYRGRAYYYRGAIRMFRFGNLSDAIKDFKMSEVIAEDADDEQLKNRVYELLDYANYYTRNSPLILKYSKKFLESSIELKDTALILRSLFMCATSHADMEQTDSAYTYVMRGLDLISYADTILLADIYAITAAMYQEKGNIKKAEEYLEKWKATKSTSYRGYITSARILKAKGRYEEAINEAKRGLMDNDRKVQIRLLELLSELYEITGDKDHALKALKQMEACADSVIVTNQAKQMTDWQRKFDEERWEKESRQRMMKMGGVIIFIFLLLVVVIWWHRRRMQKISFQLDENARRITENQTEIERLQQSGETSEQTIADLKKQIEDSRQRIASKLLTGTRQFVKLQRKEPVADMTAEERQCLIDYFAQLRPKRWQQWEHTYNPLTPAQYVFLILQDDLNYDDNTIAQILDVKPASLRTVKSRIKGRER
jgi:tetratricopeptide (TPR) repeat protein/cell division protein FtsB